MAGKNAHLTRVRAPCDRARSASRSALHAQLWPQGCARRLTSVDRALLLLACDPVGILGWQGHRWRNRGAATACHKPGHTLECRRFPPCRSMSASPASRSWSHELSSDWKTEHHAFSWDFSHAGHRQNLLKAVRGSVCTAGPHNAFLSSGKVGTGIHQRGYWRAERTAGRCWSLQESCWWLVCLMWRR